MRVVHVLRKPLSEGTVAANTLKHGVGGLNIGASRIGSDAGWSYPNGAGGNGFHGGVGRPADGSRVEPVVSRGGRWPANVMLTHLAECRYAGAREVGAGEHRINRQDTDHLEGEVHDGYRRPGRSSYTTNVVGTTRQYGKETIAAWECVEGCPVVALDEQSGVVKGTVRQPTGKPVYPTEGTAMNWNPNSVRDNTVRGFGDTGGASRYFKQIGGSKEGG